MSRIQKLLKIVWVIWYCCLEFIRLRRRPRALPVDECVNCDRIIHELMYYGFGGFR